VGVHAKAHAIGILNEVWAAQCSYYEQRAAHASGRQARSKREPKLPLHIQQRLLQTPQHRLGVGAGGDGGLRDLDGGPLALTATLGAAAHRC